MRWLRAAYIASIVLCIGSTELIVGNHISDVLEAYSAITIGTALLLVIIAIIFVRRNRLSLNTLQLDVPPEDEE